MNVIVVWMEGTWKVVDEKDSRTYENDLNWLLTIPATHCAQDTSILAEVVRRLADMPDLNMRSYSHEEAEKLSEMVEGLRKWLNKRMEEKA